MDEELRILVKTFRGIEILTSDWSKAMGATDQIRGASAAWSWSDELVTHDRHSRAVAVFETEDVPDATIEILERQLDRSDPRNPNPAAVGSAKEYILKGATRDRIGKSFTSLAAAKLKAKALHDRMVEEIMKLRHEQELDEIVQQAKADSRTRF